MRYYQIYASRFPVCIPKLVNYAYNYLWGASMEFKTFEEHSGNKTFVRLVPSFVPFEYDCRVDESLRF